MPGWFELSANDKGQHSFVLKAGNAEVILRSEQYESLASAKNGIDSVQRNSGLEDRYDKKVASDGRFYFNLKAGNHQVIGTSQMYKSESGCKNGMKSVARNAADAKVEMPG